MSTRSPYRVEQLCFLLIREPTVRFARILERRCFLFKKNHKIQPTVSRPSHCPFFLVFLKEEDHYSHFCLFPHFFFSQNSQCVPYLGFLTLDTMSAIHFHPLSTHATYVTRVHVICDFCHITYRFMAPDTRCLEKCANFDCLRIRRNLMW